MKKYLYILLTAGTIASLTSCNKLLDDNRYPEDTQTNSPEFWNNVVNVQGEVNGLYNYYYGYGNAAGRNGTFYFQSLNDDQIGDVENGGFKQWDNLTVPGAQTSWNNSYIVIRRCNYIIENVATNSMSPSQKANFMGMAKVNRARENYSLVQHFGNVPLIMQVIDPSDDALLYGPATDRNVVMDSVVADLDYAIANIGTVKEPLDFSQDMARALKVEACLYEATYQKYYNNDNTRANQFFQMAVDAAAQLLNKYSFCSDYASIYNSCYSGEDGIALLQNNPEIIFMKAYERGVVSNSISKYTATATPIDGMSKDAFDSYLFVDGKPLASTSENTSDMGYMDETGLCIQNLLDVRDKRLSAVIDPYVYYDGLPWKRSNSDLMTSLSGYGCKKFSNPLMNTASAQTDSQGFLAAPLFWISKVALEYAEAKAEMGTLTDADLNISLNPLYLRAGLPAQTVSSLSSINDPANNMGVSSLIWEVRRCRRAELMYDGYRYWDLIRWHQLDKLDTTKYPNINLGANITPALEVAPANNVNGYFQMFPNNQRIFEDKYYLYPIGQTQINQNPNLKQNPGWN
ncbi:MAG: RagB/SusD family nutrient uptake outer membrane protein [Muribaculaceae bacterium]|nr:RagB/SusD family nutrient uptake outer membrane protein [Muribaculaceae bacterium]